MEKIKAIEDEIARTQKNKATMGHLCRLKAQLAKYKRELLLPQAGGGSGKGEGFDVPKSGDIRIGLIGFPSVGKSTLLTNLAGVHSEAAAYEFTTMTCIPGILEYKGAKIQILDLPGIIEGAKDGKGRGRQVITVARTCNLLYIVLDIMKPIDHKRIIERELEGFGIRINKSPPNIVFHKRSKGGINFSTTCPELTYLDADSVKAILQEYKIHNAEVLLKENATADDFIDVVEGNRVYIPAIYCFNKIDQISIEELDIVVKIPHVVPISGMQKAWRFAFLFTALLRPGHHRWNFDELLEKSWEYMNLVRVYTKPKGQLADFDAPVILKSEKRTIENFCNSLHRDLIHQFKYALVWGTSCKFSPQRCGKDHVLADEDVVQIVKK